MASNSFGDVFRITTFGESHGIALGVVLDGCPAGISLTVEDFLPELARRRPGQSPVTTARSEADAPVLVSGVFEGQTTGMPICVLIHNEDARSKDYSPAPEHDRPGHADSAYREKYGHRDHRGGGRSSGRETVARVIAGVVARKLLPKDLSITAHVQRVGSITAIDYQPETIDSNPMRCADPQAAALMEQYVLDLKEEGDSSGAHIEVRVSGMPQGLGDPVFKKLKSDLAQAVMSIGAVTGFSYGAGFETAKMRGTDYLADPTSFGGILGGLSTGEDLHLDVSIKPTTSIADVAKRGRHDPCIAPRVIPVVESMVAVVLANAYLRARIARSD